MGKRLGIYDNRTTLLIRSLLIYLEAHESDLTRCDEISAFGHTDTGNIVGMPVKKSLLIVFETF